MSVTQPTSFINNNETNYKTIAFSSILEVDLELNAGDLITFGTRPASTKWPHGHTFTVISSKSWVHGDHPVLLQGEDNKNYALVGLFIGLDRNFRYDNGECKIINPADVDANIPVCVLRKIDVNRPENQGVCTLF